MKTHQDNQLGSSSSALRSPRNNLFLQGLPEPIINAVGYSTRVGGSCPSPHVQEVMREANRHYYQIDDLLEYGSRVIAKETGAEAGLVTCGAAAALTLGCAAILAGRNVEAMEALPDVSGLERQSFLYPVRNRYDYDHPVRASGAKLIEFDFKAEGWEDHFRVALKGPLAGVIYVWKHRKDGILIARIAELCREGGIPFLLDAAMGLPPAENIRTLIASQPDLVALSGGKHLGGPQNSGLLFGKKELIDSAWLQMVDMDVRKSSWSLSRLYQTGLVTRPPRHGLGRGFKVGKDALLGCLAALEAYAKRDHAAEVARWHTICSRLTEQLSGQPGFRVEYLTENATGQYPAVQIEASSAEVMLALKNRLNNQSPRILLSEDEDLEAVARIYPICLKDDEVDVLGEHLLAAMAYEG